MIWTILLVLLITIASLLVILLSLILFPVITFGVAASVRPSLKRVMVQGSWLHPRIVTFSFDLLSQKINLTFLGFKLFREKSVDTKQNGKTPSSEIIKDTATKSPGPFDKKVEPEIIVSSKTTDSEQTNQYRLLLDKTEEHPILQEKVLREADTSGIPNPETMNVESGAANTPESQSFSEKIFEVGEEIKGEGEKIHKAEVEQEKVEIKPESEGGGAIREKKGTAEEKRSEEKAKESKPGFISKLKKNRYVYMLRQDKLLEKLFKWLLRVLKALLKIIRFDHFNASIIAGMEEPALLGKIYAVYTMARSTVIVSNGKPVILFEPVFMKNCFDGEVSFRLKTSVIMLLWPGIIALTTFPYFTVLWLFWKSRNVSKQA